MGSVDPEDLVCTCLLFVLHLEPSSPQRLALNCCFVSKVLLTSRSGVKLTLAAFVLSPLADERGGKGWAADADWRLLRSLCVAVRVGHRRHWHCRQEQGAQRQDLLLPDWRAGPARRQVSFIKQRCGCRDNLPILEFQVVNVSLLLKKQTKLKSPFPPNPHEMRTLSLHLALLWLVGAIPASRDVERHNGKWLSITDGGFMMPNYSSLFNEQLHWNNWLVTWIEGRWWRSSVSALQGHHDLRYWELMLTSLK